MIFEEKQLNTTIAYRCPICTKAIFGVVGIFRLSGDLIRLKCDCGESDLTITMEKEGKLRITVPCLVCGTPHSYLLSKETLFGKELFPLSCPYTGLEIGYIGEKDTVSEAIEEEGRRLQKVLEDAGIGLSDLQNDGGREPLDDPDNLGDVVHFLLCELDADEKIHCYCKEQDEIPLYNFQLLSERVRIFCECCHGEQILPLKSTSDAEAFLALDELYLK